MTSRAEPRIEMLHSFLTQMIVYKRQRMTGYSLFFNLKTPPVLLFSCS